MEEQTIQRERGNGWRKVIFGAKRFVLAGRAEKWTKKKIKV